MARFLARTILLLLGLALAAALAYGVGRFVRAQQLRGGSTPPKLRAPAPAPAPATPHAPAPLTLPPPQTTPVAPTTTTSTAAPALVELVTVVPDIALDLRYATANNMTGGVLYPVARAFLRPGTAAKLAAADADLAQHGYRLKIWDAYRPLAVQKLLYAAATDKKLVANPTKGSMHNRGAAVDVTLVDSTGTELEMPTDFDDVTVKRATKYTGASATAKTNRDYLVKTMVAHGFRSISTEWWHFDDMAERKAPLLDTPLDQVDSTP
jgi:zinc D-Ala-D-Ala dipeptidase